MKIEAGTAAPAESDGIMERQQNRDRQLQAQGRRQQARYHTIQAEDGYGQPKGAGRARTSPLHTPEVQRSGYQGRQSSGYRDRTGGADSSQRSGNAGRQRNRVYPGQRGGEYPNQREDVRQRGTYSQRAVSGRRSSREMHREKQMSGGNAARRSLASRNSYPGSPMSAEEKRRRAAVRRRRRRQKRRRMMLLTCMLTIAAGGLFIKFNLNRRAAEQAAQLKAGIAQLEQGNYEAAIAGLDELLEGSKGKGIQIPALLYRAEAEYRLQDYTAALHTYELVLQKEPNNQAAKEGEMLCQTELRNYEAALQTGICQSYVYNRMASEQLDVGDYDQALNSIERGKTALQKERMEGAETKTDETEDSLISKAQSLTEQAAKGLAYHEAVLWEYRNEYEKSLELFEAYVKQYGTDDQVEREIEFLKSRQGDSLSSEDADFLDPGDEPEETDAEGETAETQTAE